MQDSGRSSAGRSIGCFRLRLGFTLVLWVLGGRIDAETPSCPPIEPARSAKLVDYVRIKYKIPESVSLSLSSDSAVTGTCFRKVTFHGKTDLKEWDLSLYMSPDGRFLFSDLLDTQIDPADEERRESQQLMAGIVENKSASLGRDDAPVTIVEFSDFACPYCKKFAELLKELPSASSGTVRVVFHHMPLTIHPWARRAAEGAACAQLQGSEAFWALHDRLFEAQREITSANIDAKLTNLAASIKNIDLTAFSSCLTDEMSLGLVYRDINLAKANGVSATPTIFINGRRFIGFSDAAHLNQAISEAR